ncbi:MAG: hypothetical protein ACJAUN_001059 [Alcanivorax sp.]|jgi:hypothetical protein
MRYRANFCQQPGKLVPGADTAHLRRASQIAAKWLKIDDWRIINQKVQQQG